MTDNKTKVAVFDLDGTLTFNDTYVDFLLLCLKRHPIRLLRGGNLIVYLLMYKAGFRSNHWLKAKYLKTVAAGLPAVQFDCLCEAFSEKTIESNIKPKALFELDRLRQAGYCLVLATASFDFYVGHLFKTLKMDYLICTKSVRDPAGRITGEIDGKNCIGVEKARQLVELANASGWRTVDCAYSDDKVDLPLFEMANKALVVDPCPKTASLALERDFEILIWR